MTERDLNAELLEELKAELPEIEGFVFFKEDALGNLIYTNLPADDKPAGAEYKILIGANPDNVQDIIFRRGNGDNKVEGLGIETLIDIGVHRTVELDNNLPHWHNNLVIDGLLVANNALNRRNLDRKMAGVAGTDKDLPRKAVDMHPVVSRILTNTDKLTFISTFIAAMCETFDGIYDKTAQEDFMEMTPTGPVRKVVTTPEESEAITKQVAAAQRVLAVVEDSQLMQIIFSTMAHTKKLEGSQKKDSSPTPTEEEALVKSTEQ